MGPASSTPSRLMDSSVLRAPEAPQALNQSDRMKGIKPETPFFSSYILKGHRLYRQVAKQSSARCKSPRLSDLTATLQKCTGRTCRHKMQLSGKEW